MEAYFDQMDGTRKRKIFVNGNNDGYPSPFMMEKENPLNQHKRTNSDG